MKTMFATQFLQDKDMLEKESDFINGKWKKKKRQLSLIYGLSIASQENTLYVKNRICIIAEIAEVSADYPCVIIDISLQWGHSTVSEDAIFHI